MFRLPHNIHVRMMVLSFYVVFGAGLLYFFAHYVFWWILPFLSAYLLSFLLDPAIVFFTRRFRLPRGAASVFILLLLFSSIGTLCYLLFRRAWYELYHITLTLPALGESFSQRLNNIFSFLSEKCLSLGLPLFLPEDINNFLYSLLSRLSASFPQIASTLFTCLKNVGTALPQYLLSFVVFFISSYFFCKDHHKIKKALLHCLPAFGRTYFYHLKTHLFSTLSSYCKAQLLLMTITFMELLIGLCIARVDFVVLSAVCIALIDVLPFLGTGFILLPWSIYAWAGGDTRTCVILLLLYLCIVLVRQLLEPQIIGQSIGLYPLATLICLYIGFHVGGIWGMMLSPMFLLLLQFTFLEFNRYKQKKCPHA